MKLEEFRENAHKVVDWIYDYYKNVEKYDVLPDVKAGEIYSNLTNEFPFEGESFETIFNDFQNKIMPGITHWQNPNFFAFFPSNTSYPSLLAEFLTAGLGAQCMSWITSPAATELEQLVTEWLRDIISLPKNMTGVIQDTASTSTLCSILTARERKSNLNVNLSGLVDNKENYICYMSDQAHSSIEKAIKITGIGTSNIRYIKTNDDHEMDPLDFEKVILEDINNGYKPLHVTVAIGTTGSVSVDPLNLIGEIATKYNVWVHVDAAYAGTAFICEEFRWMLKGSEFIDSFVFNAHKWMLTNFDCSLYFVKDVSDLVRTFEILPEYLKSLDNKPVINYRDWGIQLGRRFRALKLWFVIRHYGVNGLKSFIRNQITITKNLVNIINEHQDFEVSAKVHLNVICFRYKRLDDTEKANYFNETLMKRLNESGKYFFSHTKLNNKFVIRFCIGQTNVENVHVLNAWEDILKFTKEISAT